MKSTVMPSPGVNGFRKPGEDPLTPENGLSDETIKVAVITKRLTNMSIAWATSVLDTAKNPADQGVGRYGNKRQHNACRRFNIKERF